MRKMQGISKITFDLIAAADNKMGIGKNGSLPWKLKSEMAFFSKMTTKTTVPGKKNAVIMGRATWDSIPPKHRPLLDRLNIVLSNTLAHSSGCVVCPSLQDALTTIENNHSDIERVWIIGGANVYKEAMEHPNCNKVYLTEVEGNFGCNTFFPEIPSRFVKLTDHGDESEDVPTEVQQENDIKYCFKIYQNMS